MSTVKEIIEARKAKDKKTVSVVELKRVGRKPRFGKRPRLGEAPDIEEVKADLEEAKTVAEDVKNFRKEVKDKMLEYVRSRLEICRMLEVEDRTEEEIRWAGLEPRLKEVEKDIGEALEATFPYREPALVSFGFALVAVAENELELEWGIQSLKKKGFLDVIPKNQEGGFFRFRGSDYNLGREFNGSEEAVEVMSGLRKLASRFHKEMIRGYLDRVAELKKKAGPNPVLPNEIGKREGLGYIYVPSEKTPDGHLFPSGWILFETGEDRIQPVDAVGKIDHVVKEMADSKVSILVKDIGREKQSEYIPSKERFRLTFIFLKMLSQGVASFDTHKNFSRDPDADTAKS